MEKYKNGDTIYILMNARMAKVLADDWMVNGYACDLLIRRSNTSKGCVVIETKDVMWASRLIKWFTPIKVTYKIK